MSRGDQAGYSVAELTLVLLLVSAVTIAAFSLLSGQRRFYTVELQLAEARSSARIALEVLATELRSASPGGGDLYAIAGDSVALRSYRGLGFVCSVADGYVGIRLLAGTLASSPTDSALIFLENSYDTEQDDDWVAAEAGTAGRSGSRRCRDGEPPDLELPDGWPLTGAVVGSPVRGFRPYVYRLYRAGDDGWWLGQRPRGERVQPVVGPFASPAEGGLRLQFFDRFARETSEPRAVAQVRITVRARTPEPLPGPAGPAFLHDSLSIHVSLRNVCWPEGSTFARYCGRREGSAE